MCFLFKVYVLEDSDLPSSPSKKTSRELAGTLRNLKKVEQALQVLERVTFEDDDEDGLLEQERLEDEDLEGNDEEEDDEDEEDYDDESHKL